MKDGKNDNKNKLVPGFISGTGVMFTVSPVF